MIYLRSGETGVNQSLVAGQTQEGASAVDPLLSDTENSVLSSNSNDSTTVEDTHPQYKTDEVITSYALLIPQLLRPSVVLKVNNSILNLLQNRSSI